ncbi:unnamed protein product [Heligmosomoides polygyrus]|uniref:RRM domain-containing protein n=1 Tax=Heligmosomoides polygyrus TaxID=6339 RepID=A0A183GX21_HELPZ|nr:unnamed protein product [Heligmosomoides polygyrus]
MLKLMTSMDMSLDEIIAKSRREKRGGARGSRKGFLGRCRPDAASGGRFARGKPFRSYADFDAPVPVRVPKIGGSTNPNKTVRINISNLPSDLEELFVNYRIEAATNIINDFKGVALDGQVMRMVIVDGSEVLSSRVQIPTINGGGPIRSIRNGGERRES